MHLGRFFPSFVCVCFLEYYAEQLLARGHLAGGSHEAPSDLRFVTDVQLSRKGLKRTGYVNTFFIHPYDQLLQSVFLFVRLVFLHSIMGPCSRPLYFKDGY